MKKAKCRLGGGVSRLWLAREAVRPSTTLETMAHEDRKQTIYDEDAEENQTWYFYPSGSKKGQGYTGERDNRVYVNGLNEKSRSGASL